MTTTPNELEKWLTDKQVGARFGVSRKSIWAWVKTRNFPAPVKFGPSTTRWRLSEIEAWERARASEAA